MKKGLLVFILTIHYNFVVYGVAFYNYIYFVSKLLHELTIL